MRGIAALPGSTKPEIVELAEPSPPAPGEVLCRTLKLGICGTDREIVEAARPLVPPGAEWLVLGHECLARVEQCGPGVDALAEGDLVVAMIRRARADAPPLRVDLLPYGSYTERGIVEEHGFSVPHWVEPAAQLLRVDPEIADVAVLAEPLAVAEKAANEALILQRARLGDDAWSRRPPRVLVTGMGPIAFSGLLAAAVRGWPVTMYGLDAADTQRAELAQRLGATYLPAQEANFEPADVAADGYNLVFECTGSEEVALRSARALGAAGIMVWLGSRRQQHAAPAEVARLMRDGLLRNHIYLGSVNAAPRDFRDALAHLAILRTTHVDELRGLMTHEVALDEAPWHYHNHAPQGIKIVVRYD